MLPLGLPLIGLLAAGPGHVIAEAGQLVVFFVKNTKDWTTGQVIPPGGQVSLPADAEIRVVTEDARQIIVRGPFNGTIETSKKPATIRGQSKSPRSVLSALQNVLEMLSLEAALGVPTIRGELGARFGDPWVIDLTTGGDKCVPSGKTAVLWLPAPKVPMSITLSNGPDRRELVWWPESVETVSWPARIPMIDGERYLLEAPEPREPKILTVHVIPASLQEPLVVATRMLQYRCNDQALLLLSRLPIERTLGWNDAVQPVGKSIGF